MRGLSIYASLVAAGIRGALQYRTNFLVDMVMGLIYQGTGFIFIWVVLSRFPSVAGWRLGDMAFLYGLRLVISSGTEIAFPYLRVAPLVRLGEFDRFMVRPYPVLVQAMTQRVQVSLFGDFLGGVTLFIAANHLVDVRWSALSLAYLVLCIVAGCFIQASFMLVVIGFTFRSISTGMMATIVDDLVTHFGNYPLKIFPSAMRLALTFGLPLAFMAYFPATVLLSHTGELTIPSLFAYLSPLVAVIWFSSAYRFMTHEMRHYQSSGH